MFKMRGWSRFLLIVGVLLAAGPAVRAQEENPTGLTLDEEFARLAEAVPGFGGLYLDAEGTTHVYLQDLSHAREVQDLGERVEVHQGDYNFRDLLAWKGAVRDLLAQRGAVFLDIDEQRNRLLFGVEREALGSFSAELARFLRGARVPSEAVLVEATEPIVPDEQLTDTIRPVPGGVRIRNQNGGGCTLGFNAIRAGVRGFVTNSHCTVTRGVVEGTVMFQATTAAANQIGVETVDPKFFTGGSCPSGRKCRLSDAAFIAYDDDELSAGGQIANPLVCGFLSFPGTLDVNPNDPRTTVTGFMFGSPLFGSMVTRVGATSGCAMGMQLNTCVDANVANTNFTMLCQNRYLAFRQGGDSGSPVFLKKSGNKATMVGIHWGGSGNNAVYSPFLFIFTELGGVIPVMP